MLKRLLLRLLRDPEISEAVALFVADVRYCLEQWRSYSRYYSVSMDNSPLRRSAPRQTFAQTSVHPTNMPEEP